jgi:hypothetical protein
MSAFTSTGAVNQSITRIGRNEPFELQVARNQITFHNVVNIFGYQPSVTTTSIPVWENASAYTFPSSALVMTLLSSSASDTNVSVLINGLDANYNMISETVTGINGTTGVTTTNSYLRINSMFVTSTTALVGNITAKNSTTTYAQINAGVNKTQMAIYTVPAGYSFYLNRIDVFASNPYTSANYLTFTNVQTTNGVTFAVAQSPFISILDIHRQYPLAYAEKTDIQFQVKTSSSTYAVGAFGEGVLVKNDGTL